MTAELQLPRRRLSGAVTYLLAIDTGSNMGVAAFGQGRLLKAETWKLGIRKGEHPGSRFRAFREKLAFTLRPFEPGEIAIAYEEIRFPHKSTGAAAVYHGLIAHLQEYCYARNIQLMPQHTGTIKKTATTVGNAGKAMMLQAFARETGIQTEDDNIADAYWIGRCGLAEAGIKYRGVQK